MSKKITHEKARNTLFSGNVPEIIVTRHLKTDELIELDFYITQQEKQDKLLELYKEYFKYSEKLKDGRKFGGRMLVEHERDKLSEEIKELEI